MAPVETPKCICWPLSCTDDGCHTFVRHRLAPQATPQCLPAGISRHLRLPPAFSGWSSRLNTSFFSSSSPRSRASAGFVTDSMPFRAGTAPCNAGLDHSSCNNAPLSDLIFRPSQGKSLAFSLSSMQSFPRTRAISEQRVRVPGVERFANPQQASHSPRRLKRPEKGPTKPPKCTHSMQNQCRTTPVLMH